MKFSKEEKKKIDNILAQVEIEQKENGNQLYLLEDVAKDLFTNRNKKGKKYRIHDISY